MTPKFERLTHGRRRGIVWLVLLVCLPTAATRATADDRKISVPHAAVVSVCRQGNEAGVATLHAGGNAVDAAVATAFALAVTYPPAGNIGGGGFMIVHPGGGEPPLCIDYRETAPAAATPTMFGLDADRHTHLQVGVPGTVRGLALAHQRFGKLPWKKLLEPAIRLAAKGFEVREHLAADLNDVLADAPHESEFQRVFAAPRAGGTWQAGDRLVQPELALTLLRIAQHGPEEFYTGETARLLVEEMKAGGGIIAPQDLAAYKAEARTPIHGTYRGYDIYGAPPPSSGGTCLVEMLNVLETFDLRSRGRWSPETVHLTIEAMRRAYLDRARWIGDPAFTDVPARLTTKEYARKLAATIDLAHATPSDSLAGAIPLAAESPHTTHFSVVDAQGMAVANTYTLEESWGSQIVVRGAGFLLNNEMGDFNPLPGHTDRRGNIGTPANVIAPGKRMLSSQCPVVVARDGKAVLVTGSPGGRTIINTVLCVLLGVLEFDEDLHTAIEAPRLHHQWLPDRVSFEGVDAEKFAPLVAELQRMGHRVRQPAYVQGDAHSIWIDPKTGLKQGVADRRIDGHAAGF
ncbi:MAG: gamma-glutamyltransferase [Pirellulales bacterium]|nr:gamma-glutamyltransferase [Pirellulales bacterium]